MSFGPVSSGTFIVHEYCDQRQPTQIKILSPSCQLNDTSSACNAEVLDTNYGSTIQELVPFPTGLKAFLVDADGNHVENPGTEATAEGQCSVVDPWQMTVSITAGPGGAMLAGTATVPIQGGYADFSDLALDTAGSGYKLTFSVSYSSQGNAVSSLELDFPTVEMRPLKFKVTSMPSLEKHGEPFSSPVISSLWDVVNDIAATGSVVSDAGTVNCVISLTTPGATLSGTKTATMNGKLIISAHYSLDNNYLLVIHAKQVDN